MVSQAKDRGQGRPRGSPASAAQKSTHKIAQAASVKKRKERKQKRQAELEKPRWKQLEDGDITVRDLTDKELIERACANNDGTWEGRRHQLPIRLINRMEAESVRRARNGLDRLTKPALRALRTRVEDDDNPAQQLAAAKLILEYKIGKVPEVVHIGVENDWDRLRQGAFRIERGEDAVTVPDDEDIVEGEIVEETG